MTTNIDTGEQIPVCKNHLWLYMKTLKYEDGRECYMVYCPFCWQKSIHIPDFSEKEFMKINFEKYDKWDAERKTKSKKSNSNAKPTNSDYA